MKVKLSLCLAVYNEEKNIHYPLDSCIHFVDEAIIVDGGSTDKTVEIAKSYGPKVKVFVAKNPPMFHINKQKALDLATGDFILQLDADEEVSTELAEEIKKVIKMSQEEIKKYQENLPERELFLRNQRIVEGEDTHFCATWDAAEGGGNPVELKKCGIEPSTNKSIVAFYIPRLNYFLGKFLHYGGQYPDGSIRLIKKGKAQFPCRDVHEVMEVDGASGWLKNPLLHYDSPTFKRYIERNNRYINLMADEFKQNKYPKNIVQFFNYSIVKPFAWFFGTQIMNKGILDGWQGIVFSFFSALRFPRAYIKFLISN